MAVKRTRSGASASLNLVVAVLLSVLIAFSIYLNVKTVLISSPTPGYSTINVTPRAWNIGVTIIGTVVGILASIAFSQQDAFLSRVQLASERGVPAIFLRPLTSMRGLQQIVNRQFNPHRLALVLLTLLTALMSAATVALLSAQVVTQQVTNDVPSFPLALLNSFFTESASDGAIFPLGSPAASKAMIPYVSAFMYRSALINGLKARGGYLPSPGFETAWLPEDGLVGQTNFKDLWTAGVGINSPTYFTFHGYNGHCPLPRNYTFESFHGQVFGTTINATCTNVTDSYSFSISHTLDWKLLSATEKGSEKQRNNITVLSTNNNLGIGAKINPSITSDTEPTTVSPKHIILISGSITTDNHVFECSYSGREFVADISMAGPSAPLLIGSTVNQGPVIGPAVQRLVATALQAVFGGSGGGGVLTQGFIDADYNKGGSNTTAEFGKVLETILSQSAQAAISTMRQQVEISNLYAPPPAKGAYLTLKVSWQRIGGGSYGWLAVYGLLLLGCLVGLFKAILGGEAVQFEAQDAVILMAKAYGDHQMEARTKVQFIDGVGVVRAGEDAARTKTKNDGVDGQTNESPSNGHDHGALER